MVPGRIHIAILSVFLASVLCCAQGGGPIAQLRGIVNVYEPVIGVNACDSTVRVRNASVFAVGDEVLMIQMRGAAINEANDSSYGTVLDMNGAGCAEFLVIRSINGNDVTFTSTWVHPYAPKGAIQLIRVKSVESAVTTGIVTAPPYNGAVGGVVVIHATQSLTLQSDIDVSAMGFRGGLPSIPFDVCTPTKWSTYYIYGEGAEKGMGIATQQQENSVAGRAPFGNGGGGGNGGNAGGGGGSNAGSGGHGGDANTWCPIYKRQGGFPGQSVDTLLLKQRIFLGGGGGGGHQNDMQGTAGGSGGGIVIIRTPNLISMGGNIMANGSSVTDTAAWNGTFAEPGDGAGGGGAGGSVLLDVQTYNRTVNVSVRGGNGGMMGAKYQPNGPGGGGGGGAVVVTGPTTFVNADVQGGAPGRHLSPSTADSVRGSSWGATAGSPGAVVSGFVWKTPYRQTLHARGGGEICPGDSTLLEADPGFMFYKWSNGATTRTVWVKTAGNYSVTTTDSSGCSQTVGGMVVSLDPTKVTIAPLLDFGVVDFQRVTVAQLRIVSQDDDAITISGISGGTRFVVDNSVVFPLVVPPMATVMVPITLLPSDEGEYRETMNISVSAPCALQMQTLVRAKVDPARIHISFPDTTAVVGNSALFIPLRATITTDTIMLRNARLLAKVRLNVRMLAPWAITRGTIVNDVIDVINNTRTMTIDLTEQTIPSGTTVLTEIACMVLLSGLDETPLEVLDVAWLSASMNPITTLDDGSVKVDPVCFSDGRLMRLTRPSTIHVGPNPASDHIILSATMDAVGTYTISIVDVAGATKYYWEDVVPPRMGRRTVTLRVPTDEWASGTYYVRFVGPLVQETTPVVIRR